MSRISEAALTCVWQDRSGIFAVRQCCLINTRQRTFTLRGIKNSPLHLHDGRLLTLADTVEFFELVLSLNEDLETSVSDTLPIVLNHLRMAQSIAAESSGVAQASPRDQAAPAADQPLIEPVDKTGRRWKPAMERAASAGADHVSYVVCAKNIIRSRCV